MNIEAGKTRFSPQELTDLIDAVNAARVKAGISQAEVARRADVKPATLSQFMNMNYPGDMDRVARELARWLDAHNRELAFRLKAPPTPSFVQTPTAQRVQAALQHAQLLSDLAVIVGPPGVGKTAARMHYAASTPRVYSVTCSPACSSVPAVLKQLLGGITAETTQHRGGSRHQLSEQVRGHVRTGDLIIVDEAQHANMDVLEELRAIHDACQVGLTLMGNRTVLSRIEGASRDPAYAQLFGRVGWRVSLKKGDEGDIQPVLESMGVDDASVLAEAVKIGRRDDLRVVVKVMRSAMLFASAANENVGAQHMRAAYRQLAGEGAAA